MSRLFPGPVTLLLIRDKARVISLEVWLRLITTDPNYLASNNEEVAGSWEVLAWWEMTWILTIQRHNKSSGISVEGQTADIRIYHSKDLYFTNI